eukprot:1597020-Rhodomonas_salina.1
MHNQVTACSGLRWKRKIKSPHVRLYDGNAKSSHCMFSFTSASVAVVQTAPSVGKPIVDLCLRLLVAFPPASVVHDKVCCVHFSNPSDDARPACGLKFILHRTPLFFEWCVVPRDTLDKDGVENHSGSEADEDQKNQK